MTVQEILNKRFNHYKVKNNWTVIICDFYKVNHNTLLKVILKEKLFLWVGKKIDIPTDLLNKSYIVCEKNKDNQTAIVFIENA